MFSGCKDNQTSADTFSVQLGKYGGAFTIAFLTCLRNANYKTSLLLLYRDICVFLSKNKYSQIPVFSSSSSNPLASTASLTVPIVVTNPTTNVIKDLLNTTVSVAKPINTTNSNTRNLFKINFN